LGTALSFAQGGNLKTSLAAGANALAAEMMAEWLIDPVAIEGQTKQEAAQEGHLLTLKEYEQRFVERLLFQNGIIRVGMAGLTALITRDPASVSMGIFTAANAVENNLIPSLTKSLLLSESSFRQEEEGFWRDEFPDAQEIYYHMILEEALLKDDPSYLRSLITNIQELREEYPRIARGVDSALYGVGKGLQYSAYGAAVLSGFLAGEFANPFGGGLVGAPLALGAVKSLEEPFRQIVHYGIIEPLGNWYAGKGRNNFSQQDRRFAFQQFTFEALPLLGLTGIRGVRSASPSGIYVVAAYKPPVQQGLLPTQFSKLSRQYVLDMETRSGIQISQGQRYMLEVALRSQEFKKLSSMAKIAHGNIYKNPRVKDKIISQWETHTGQVWPVYLQDIFQKNGSIVYPAGSQVQAHHIIHQSHGGPHIWWNIHPLQYAEHQLGVHKRGSPGEILHNKE